MSDNARNVKRSLLSGRKGRNLYKHAHGHRLEPSRYGALCKRADSINGWGGATGNKSAGPVPGYRIARGLGLK